MIVFKELKRRNVFKVATAYLITAWLIIQIVAVLEPHMNLPEWIVPVIIVFLVVGFPIACLFAWAFELTPEGIKRSKEVVVDDSITTITGRKLDFGIIAAMAIAVVFLTYEAYFSEDISTDNIAEISSPEKKSNEQTSNNSLPQQVTSIAVLPFVNMSNDPEQEYFSDGLSEELLNVLARIKQLKVAARTSSFFFKNKNMDIKEIAKKLDVEHVLEGSVRKSGTKLRVTAQLIQADNGFHLWSATYDYEIDDIFKIQDEISESVVQQLKITLLNEQLVGLTEHGTTNPEAQDAYLKGRYYMRSRTPASLAKAVDAFKYSISLDAKNQLAISGLVDSYNLQATYANLTNSQAVELVKSILQPFMEMQNNSAEMDTSIGAYYANISETEKAIEFYDKAIEKNPNYVQAYHWLGSLYRFEGYNLDKAKANFLKGLTLDPYSEMLLINLFGMNYQSGNMLEAENYLNLANELAPNASYGNSVTLEYYWITGRNWQKANGIVENSSVSKSQFNHDSAFNFYLALDDLDMAEKQISNVDETVAYKANIVFNFQVLNLVKLDKGLINEQQFIALINEKISQYPHNDNVIIEVDLLLRQKNYVEALNKLEQAYGYLIGKEQLHFQELVPAAYYVYVLQKLNKNPIESLSRAIKVKMLQIEKVSQLPEFTSYLKAMVYSLIKENEQALFNLQKLYVDGNFYNHVMLTKHWVVYDDLRQAKEFQQIVDIATQKLEAKRTEFKESQNEHVHVDTL